MAAEQMVGSGEWGVDADFGRNTLAMPEQR